VYFNLVDAFLFGNIISAINLHQQMIAWMLFENTFLKKAASLTRKVVLIEIDVLFRLRGLHSLQPPDVTR
jgi:hypothetical protein